MEPASHEHQRNKGTPPLTLLLSFRSVSALTLATFALGAILALSACSTKTRTVTVTERVGDPQAEERAEAAEDALAELRTSLEKAQEALAATNNREEAGKVLDDVQESLDQVQEELGNQPDSAAKTAVVQAVAAVETAVGAVNEVLADNTAMASGGVVSFANMHATLAGAQEALDAAHDTLTTALERDDLSDAQRLTLAQAQGWLTTAQVSLVPQLNQELAEAETEAAAQRARADAAESDAATQRTRADAAESDAATQRTRADAAESDAATQRTRADAAESERDTARAEIDRLTVRFGKDLSIGSREASRVAPSDDASVTLTPRRSGVRVAARETFVATSPTWISALTHYDITNYGTANTARLDIEQDPVAYGAGVAAVIPGAAGGDPATVEFPGRGQVFRGHSYDKPDFHLARQGSYGPSSDGTAASAIPRFGSGSSLRANLRGHAISSFQYREDGGLTMKFGGMDPTERPAGASAGSEGSLIYGDLEALTATAGYNCGSGGDQACDEVAARDLTVSFGTPARDPTSEPAYYWTVDAPNPKLGIAAGTTADLDQWTRADTVSVAARYEMLLSNHAGVDDQGTAATGDDEERYLRYAAYGLFQAIDHALQSARPGRMQTFHYGYDAFGTHNPLPAATADSIAATFNGRTMAWLATNAGLSSRFVAGLERMRGNVTLHACLGGGGCQASAFTAPTGAAKPSAANSLTGAIWNLEISGPGGAWVHGDGAHPSGYHAFRGDLLLAGTVTANGAFSGTVTPDADPSDSQRTSGDGGTRTAGADTHGYTIRQQVAGATQSMSDYWAAGAFEGAFYGPAEALEAAGTWWVPSARAEVLKGVNGIIGSFGARAAPDDE